MLHLQLLLTRVLARISKVPVQNSNFNISATNLFQICIPSILIAYCAQNGNLYLSHVLEDGLLRKHQFITPKMSYLKIIPAIFLPVQK